MYYLRAVPARAAAATQVVRESISSISEASMEPCVAVKMIHDIIGKSCTTDREGRVVFAKNFRVKFVAVKGNRVAGLTAALARRPIRASPLAARCASVPNPPDLSHSVSTRGRAKKKIVKGHFRRGVYNNKGH